MATRTLEMVYIDIMLLFVTFFGHHPEQRKAIDWLSLLLHSSIVLFCKIYEYIKKHSYRVNKQMKNLSSKITHEILKVKLKMFRVDVFLGDDLK